MSDTAASYKDNDWGTVVFVLLLVTIGAILLRLAWLLSLCFGPVYRKWQKRPARRVRA